MTVLVTGAGGFVGSHLLELLEDSDDEIVGWLRPGTEPLVRGRRVRWVTVEMLDREAVRAAAADARPDAIYHLAGVPHIGDSWAKVHETFAGNVLASHHLFDALRRLLLTPRVVITSTAFVYAPQNRPLREGDLIRPNSPYGTSKLAQEMLTLRAWSEDGVPAVIARSFNHVGPRQSPSFVAPGIARQIAEIEAGRKPPVIQMGNLESERDIMDVRDTVRAYRALMQSGTPGGAYNVCSGTPIRIGSLVERFLAKARVPITIAQDPARLRPNDTPVVAGDVSKLRADTGWTPLIPLNRTLDDLLAYWRSNLANRS